MEVAIMDALFDLLVWVFRASWWFLSKLLEGKLPWAMILVVLTSTIPCAVVGGILGSRPGQPSFFPFLTICALTSIGWLIGVGLAYLYSLRKE
jgi:hypothetical protein